MISNSTPSENLPKINKKPYTQTRLYKKVHSSFIHDSYKTETT